MADDPNLPPSDPAPIAPARAERVRPTCEFCGCTLTQAGEVVKVGDAAKRFRAHGETIEKHLETIGKLEAELRDVRAQLAEARGVKAAGSKGGFLVVGE